MNIVEGKPPEYPYRNDTLYITSIRDPVSRILSSYKFEGRWNCKQLVRNKEYIPSRENERSLEDDIQLIDSKWKNNNGCTDRKIWRCTTNCYLLWWGKDFGCLVNETESYQTALERLTKYDIIIVTERLKDPNYVQGLHSLFGMNKPSLTESRKSFCGPQSKRWNTLYPYQFSNDTIQSLQERNQYDNMLFRQLNNCPNGIIFPDQ